MRKFVFLVSVLSLACCIGGHRAAIGGSLPCEGHGGYSHSFAEPFLNTDGKCWHEVTYFCCDGTILNGVKRHWWYICPDGGCGCTCDSPTYPCGIDYHAVCASGYKCNSVISGEDTESGCHYVVKNYDCDGNFTDQTETDTGSPPDGRTCCESVPPDQLPSQTTSGIPGR